MMKPCRRKDEDNKHHPESKSQRNEDKTEAERSRKRSKSIYNMFVAAFAAAPSGPPAAPVPALSLTAEQQRHCIQQTNDD
jgi:hypothetical protein